jgi:hypothetical protein
MAAFPLAHLLRMPAPAFLKCLAAMPAIIYFASRFTYYLDNLATPPGRATWGCGAEPAKGGDGELPVRPRSNTSG